jgi:hypothetical protein
MIDFLKASREISEYNEKGFDFQQFPSHTHIILKTKNSNYDLELVEKKKALILGGNMASQFLRFPNPTLVSLVGSAAKNSLIPRENWIGFGMRFEFVVDETQQVIITSEVVNAEIHAQDNSWFYSMDWQ